MGGLRQFNAAHGAGLTVAGRQGVVLSMVRAPGVAYRRDIDGLRCVAVVPVVLSHAGLAGFSGGFVGVDIFFVISGFLITSILIRDMEAGRHALITFYERRARRILPALFALLAICAIAGWFLFPPWQYEAFGKAGLATLFFASNIWFWRETGDYFGTDAEYEPLLHTWSLAVEEQFYIVFPLILWALVRRGGGRWRAVAVVAVLSALSFALSVWATRAMPLANFFLAPMRAWELGLGALLALGAFPVARGRASREGAAAIGLGLILGSIVMLDAATPFPGLGAFPACAGAAAIIWAGTGQSSAGLSGKGLSGMGQRRLGRGRLVPGRLAQGQSGWGRLLGRQLEQARSGIPETFVGRILSTRVMVGIGAISYSLYLWHWPPLVVARTLGGGTHISAPLALAALGAGLALAWVSWRYVERPFRAHGAGRAGGSAAGFGRAAIFGLSGAGALGLMAVLGACVVLKGLPGRVPADLRAAYDRAVTWSALELRCRAGRPDTGLCTFGAIPETDLEPKSGSKSGPAFGSASGPKGGGEVGPEAGLKSGSKSGPGSGPGSGNEFGPVGGPGDRAGEHSGAQSPPEVLIWGDSHAAALLPGFEAWLQGVDRVGSAAVMNACAPLLGVMRLDAPNGSACVAFNIAVRDHLAAHPDIKTVILVGRWPLLVEGDRPGGEAGRAAVLRGIGAAGVTDNPAVFEYGLTGTLAALTGQGKTVILLDALPEIGTDVARALVASAFWPGVGVGSDLGPGLGSESHLGLENVGPSRAQYEARTARTAAILDRVSDLYPVHRVPVADVLCDPQCRVAGAGGAFYRDDDHLSVAGATWLVPRILPADLP